MRQQQIGDRAWGPSACSLPTEDRPFRVAEFDGFFAEDAVGLSRPTPHRLHIDVCPGPGAASRAAGLAVRETGCCSFFSFELTMSAGAVHLSVSAGEGHAHVLAALGDRAERLIAGVPA